LTRKQLLRIGRVRKPHGVRGKVSVYLFNASTPSLRIRQQLWAGDDEASAASRPPLTVAAVQGRPGGERILTFEGIASAEQAAALRNLFLFIDRREVEVGDDEIVIDDLVGMAVEAGGERVGNVAGCYPTGAGDVLVIDTPDGAVDFPLHDDYIEFIDETKRILRVRHFEGFRDIARGGGGKGRGGP
jgi:16S rRNA processing protein RimM